MPTYGGWYRRGHIQAFPPLGHSLHLRLARCCAVLIPGQRPEQLAQSIQVDAEVFARPELVQAKLGRLD